MVSRPKWSPAIHESAFLKVLFVSGFTEEENYDAYADERHDASDLNAQTSAFSIASRAGKKPALLAVRTVIQLL